MKTLLVAALVALVVPVAAEAKELTAVTLCGASGCATNDNPGVGHVAPFTEESLLPASPGPYYRIELTVDGYANAFGDAYYVPSTGRVAFANEEAWTQWARPTPELAPLLRDLASKLEPLTVPTVTGAFVGTRRVRSNPSSYLRLFSVRGPSTDPVYAAARRSIWFTANRQSPWTSTRIYYFPAKHVLQLAPYQYVRLPLAYAKAVQRARPLREPQKRSRAPWFVAGVLAVGLVAAGGFAVRRR